MKLIVQVPCFNEADTLPETLRDIPRQVDGVDRVEILIVDDGSTDDTVAVARAHGVDHIERHKTNLGLARSFRTGLQACLRHGADIIVNTDGDNQYAGGDIATLIAPIVAGEADIVVGDRQTNMIPHFSWTKKRLQAIGSYFVRQLSGTQVADAVSGFRALSRDAALRINILSTFSYTLEMLIQAGNKQMAVASVPIGTNPKTRDSRLFKSIPQFLKRSLATVARMYAMYRPLRVFFWIGATLCALGLLPMVRFLFFYAVGQGDGHVQSLVIGGVLLVIGFVTLLFGLLADLVSFNRQLIENTLYRTQRIELALAQLQAGHVERMPAFDSEAVRQELADMRGRAAGIGT